MGPDRPARVTPINLLRVLSSRNAEIDAIDLPSEILETAEEILESCDGYGVPSARVEYLVRVVLFLHGLSVSDRDELATRTHRQTLEAH